MTFNVLSQIFDIIQKSHLVTDQSSLRSLSHKFELLSNEWLLSFRHSHSRKNEFEILQTLDTCKILMQAHLLLNKSIQEYLHKQDKASFDKTIHYYKTSIDLIKNSSSANILRLTNLSSESNYLITSCKTALKSSITNATKCLVNSMMNNSEVEILKIQELLNKTSHALIMHPQDFSHLKNQFIAKQEHLLSIINEEKQPLTTELEKLNLAIHKINTKKISQKELENLKSIEINAEIHSLTNYIKTLERRISLGDTDKQKLLIMREGAILKIENLKAETRNLFDCCDTYQSKLYKLTKRRSQVLQQLEPLEAKERPILLKIQSIKTECDYDILNLTIFNDVNSKLDILTALRNKNTELEIILTNLIQQAKIIEETTPSNNRQQELENIYKKINSVNASINLVKTDLKKLNTQITKTKNEKQHLELLLEILS